MQDLKDKREQKAAEIISRGHASMRELLEVSFGEWPPKGLDVDESIDLSFRVDVSRNKSISSMGLAYVLKKNIEISDVYARYLPALSFCKGVVPSVLGHEAIHILQSSHYYRPEDVFIPEDQATEAEADRVVEANLTRHNEVNELLEEDKAFTASKGALTKCFNAVARPILKFKYMSRDNEMQAHLHEVLMAGYEAWGRLPGDHYELWAALSSAKMHPPLSVKDHLERLPKDAPAQDFLKAEFELPSHLSRMNDLSYCFEGAVQERFWEETMPIVYADLIEMYGDKLGRERFGLGKNERLEFYKRGSNKKAVINSAPTPPTLP